MRASTDFSLLATTPSNEATAIFVDAAGTQVPGTGTITVEDTSGTLNGTGNGSLATYVGCVPSDGVIPIVPGGGFLLALMAPMAKDSLGVVLTLARLLTSPTT